MLPSTGTHMVWSLSKLISKAMILSWIFLVKIMGNEQKFKEAVTCPWLLLKTALTKWRGRRVHHPALLHAVAWSFGPSPLPSGWELGRVAGSWGGSPPAAGLLRERVPPLAAVAGLLQGTNVMKVGESHGIRDSCCSMTNLLIRLQVRRWGIKNAELWRT